MPSMADLIFVAILGAVLLTPLSVKVLNDAGIGWHIRTGQLIVATHSVPHVDPFSSQLQKSWIAWEWLYDLVVGKLETTAGLNGVVWFTAVVIAATFAALFRLLLRRGANLFMGLLLTLLAIAASMIHFLARPHVVSWLFALAWFWLLDSNESVPHQTVRRIWLLPVLMLVWVNVHGGFLLGFVMLGIYWLSSLWMWLRSKESRIEESFEKIAAGKRVKVLTLVGLASAIASLVNPYGWRMHSHIYSYLTNRFFMDHIDEFQSPNFHGMAQRCFLVTLLIAFAAVAVRARSLRPSQILLVLFSIYAGLYASRNIPAASILLALIVGPMIPSWGFFNFAERMRALESTLRGHLWPIAVTIFSCVIALDAGRTGSTQFMDAHFDPQRMPVAAVNFVDQSGLHGPVLSPDYWGGYLIYRLYPQNRIVIDDRHDFYGEKFLQSYLAMLHVAPGWDAFLKGRTGCLVFPRKAALTTLLSRTPEWKIAYSDDVAVVFVPTRIPRDQDRARSQ